MAKVDKVENKDKKNDKVLKNQIKVVIQKRKR